MSNDDIRVEVAAAAAAMAEGVITGANLPRHTPDDDNVDEREHQVQRQQGATSTPPPPGNGNNVGIAGLPPPQSWWHVVFLPPIGGPSSASQCHPLLGGRWSSGDATSAKGAEGSAGPDGPLIAKKPTPHNQKYLQWVPF
jgi:hypothetical protein